MQLARSSGTPLALYPHSLMLKDRNFYMWPLRVCMNGKSCSGALDYSRVCLCA